jgi:hypothetical protein
MIKGAMAERQRRSDEHAVLRASEFSNFGAVI